MIILRHLFLEKLYKYTTFPHQFPESKSQKKQRKKLKKKYGFDIRECYDVELSIYALLYERLCAYEKHCNVDLDSTLDGFMEEYKGKKYTLREMIHMLKDHIKSYIKYKYTYEYPDKAREAVNEICDIWKQIGSRVWW